MNKLPVANDIPGQGQQPSETFSEEDFWQTFLRHRWMIASSVAIFVLGAFVYLIKAQPIYTSSSRIYVEQAGPRIIGDYEKMMGRPISYLYTQGELIRSNPIISRVVDDPRISKFETFNDVDNPLMYVKHNLAVSIGKRDDIVTVSFDSPYPEESAAIVNGIVDSYIAYNSRQKRSIVSEVLKILQKEKIKRDAELSGKFDELREFTREHGVVSLEQGTKHVVFERLAKLSEALTEAQLQTISAKADYDAVKSMGKEPLKIKQFAAARQGQQIRPYQNDVETQLLSELEQARVELENARLHCTDDHPSVKAILAKIVHINSQLTSRAKDFADSYIEVMQLRHETAQKREKELDASFQKQRLAARELGIKATEYSVLQSELKRTERLCEILDDRMKELNVKEDVGMLNISILECARPALNPSHPRKARVMGLALVL